MLPSSIISIGKKFQKHTNPLPKPIFDFTITLHFTTSSSLPTFLQPIPNTNKQPEIPAANPLYNLLPHTHNPNNIVNLICSNLKQNNGLPTSLRQDIQWVLPNLGPDEISRVLLRCQSDPLTSFNFFIWVRNDLGIRPNIHNYCILLHILTWSGKFTMTMKVLLELIEIGGKADVFQNLVLCIKGCNWSQIVFDMLIKAYVKMGKIQEGLNTFKKTITIGFAPDVSACNCLLNGVLKSNRLDWCWEVYNEMEKMEISPNTYTFNILTHVLCKDGDVGKVNGFLDKMEEEGFDPDVVTYNTLIESYCRKGRLDDAFYLYKIMYRRFVPPDLVTYTALMKGLCNIGKLKEAHQLFHRMIHRGFIPDVVAYNSLISGYCKEGRIPEAKSLMHEMMRGGVSPNSFTCRLLVEGYGKERKLLSSLNLVAEFERLKVFVPLELYNYLGVALCQENKPYAAKNFLRRTMIDGGEPTLDVYNELIQCFCKSDDLDEAFLLKNEMLKKGLKLNMLTYRIMISCLCRLRRSAEGESMMREMIEAGLVPDSAICRILVNGYCEEKGIEKAQSVLIFFSSEFQIYDTESFNALIQVCCEEGDVMKSLELQDKMLKIGYMPNSLTCKSLIHGLSRAGNGRKKLQGVSVENHSTEKPEMV